MKTTLSKPKAIRLSLEEEKRINEFLRQNPFFDFSTLARTAISNFIENPKLEIKPIAPQLNQKEAQL